LGVASCCVRYQDFIMVAVNPNEVFIFLYFTQSLHVSVREGRSFGLQTETHVTVGTRPAHQEAYNYFNAVFICFELVLRCYYKNLNKL
jgi:hypothetical protein